MDSTRDDAGRQIQARFVTKLNPPLKTANSVIAIPANLTRLGLSTIVNTLLKSGDPDWKTQPFDFLIDGELVRMSLEKFLVTKGISVEKVLEIEYIKVVVPKTEGGPYLHDDWVSALDGSDPHFFVSGSYDGTGRLFKAAGKCTHVLEGHGNAITSVCVTSSKGVDAVTLATASKDHTLRLWKLHSEVPVNESTHFRAFKILRGHNASVQSVATQTSGSMICSGSWDCAIRLWQTNESDAEESSLFIKKRRVGSELKESQLEGEAVSVLVGHTQCVTSVVWPKHEVICSASWDHSIRSWNIETSKDFLHIFCGNALNCIHVGGEGSALVAGGGSDSILRVWDPRKPGTSAPIYQFSFHNSWISACKWHPESWFHLLSSSFDGKVMLWDLRTVWPVAVINSHEDKVLCADWWKGDSVISGGVDKKLCISSGISFA